MKLCEFLRITRARHLAQKAGLAPGIISNFLSGRRGLSAQSMAKIVKATGGLVSFEDLLNEAVENKRLRAVRGGDAQDQNHKTRIFR